MLINSLVSETGLDSELRLGKLPKCALEGKETTSLIKGLFIGFECFTFQKEEFN